VNDQGASSEAIATSEKSIREAIAREEAKIDRVERAIKQSRAVLESLRAELPAGRLSSPSPLLCTTAMPTPVTSAEKVALFRSLFRGRDDLYPKFWSNTRTGRKGYAPACANEWVRGVCEKPRVKCGECSHQAFMPVDDQVILDHLQGRHVVGVYPLLHRRDLLVLGGRLRQGVLDRRRDSLCGDLSPG